jgi:ABC-2 type transport system permease protein
VVSEAPGALRTVSAEPPLPNGVSWSMLPGRVAALSVVELHKMRHDWTELCTRAVQPLLWLLIFGETFTRIHAIPTGGRPYLDFLAPGILAQSALFVAIFYGIHIIWERDAGILTRLLVTPTPRAALILGKAFAAGIRGLTQVVVVLIVSAALGVSLTANPLKILAAAVLVVLSAGFFATLSMTLAGLALSRDRLMGIGQAITMPLFFASNALYPVKVMPGWVQAITKVNPLSYEVNGLRGLLIGTHANLAEDFGVVILALVLGVTAASALLGRLARA